MMRARELQGIHPHQGRDHGSWGGPGCFLNLWPFFGESWHDTFDATSRSSYPAALNLNRVGTSSPKVSKP